MNDPTADAGPQDTQSESTVVRVGDSDNLVASFNDSGSFTSAELVQFTGYATSSDNGRTWTDRGALPANPLGDVGDPVLAYSERSGAVMLVTLQCVDAECSSPGPGVQFFTSTDAGVTFGLPTSAPFGPESVIDKEWIAVDNFAGDGYGRVFVMARDFGSDGGMEFIRSLDDGATWDAPVHIADGGQGAFVTVTPDHAVQAFWLDEASNIRVRVSTDGGVSFGPDALVADLGDVGNNGDVFVNGGPRSNSFVHAAVAPDTGALFAVFNDLVDGATTPDVFITSSSDGGSTWTPPARINSDATGDQWSPTIAVAPDGASAMVSWYDRRNDPENLSIQRFGAIARLDAGAVTVGTNVPLSAPFPVVIGQDPLINPTYMGDYDMIAAGSNGFVATWGDNGGASASHAHQPDVRAAVLPTTPAAADMSITATAPPVVALGSSGTIGYDIVSAGDASMASLTIAAPAGSALGTPNSSAAECSGSGRVAACLFGDLADGAPVHVDVPIIPLAAGVLDVTASVVHAGEELDADDDEVTTTFEATGEVPLDRTTSTERCEIPDETIVECPLAVGASGPALNVTAALRLEHSFIGDLAVNLVAPDGRTVPLFASVFPSNPSGGAGTGPDPCDGTTVYTTFRDDAVKPMRDYPAPFAGAVRPTGALSGLATSERAGVWKLRIADVAAADEGVLLCWSLTTGALPPPQDPPSEIDPFDRTISIGSPSVVEGDTGNRRVVFPVVLSQPSTEPFDVDFVVMGCNFGAGPCGRQGFDFEVRSGRVHFGLGPDGLTPTSRTVWARVVPDQIPEGDPDGQESFSVRVTGAPPGWSVFNEEGFGIILDDDPGSGALSVGLGGVVIDEGDSGGPNLAMVRLALNRRPSSPVRVRLELVPFGAEPGTDYEDWGGTRVVTLDAQHLANGAAVAIIPDTESELGDEGAIPEAVAVRIVSVTPGVEISRGSALVLIADDDFDFTKPSRRPGSDHG